MQGWSCLRGILGGGCGSESGTKAAAHRLAKAFEGAAAAYVSNIPGAHYPLY